MTVYQRICVYEKHNRFRFTPQGRKNVGMDVRREWASLDRNIETSLEDSKEPDGTYKVISYPDDFTPNIDLIIARYATRMFAKGKKRIIEKPNIDPTLLKTTDPILPRKRTRKPLPAFSTRKK